MILGINGAGKSSLMDAISFGLFGKPFRNINKTNIANSITRQQCTVEIEFAANGHNFKVKRGVRPNLFEIYKDDILLKETANVKDYQEDFEKNVLKCNFKTFTQIVMLGSAIFTPFMVLPAQSRRDVIEDLLDLKIFTTMNSLLKEKISNIDVEIYKKQQQKNLLQEKITLTEKYIKELYESNDQLIEEKRKNIKDIFQQIENIKEQIVVYNQQIAELVNKTINFNALQKKIIEITKLNHQLQHKTQLLTKEISFLEGNENCPTCNQKIDEIFKIKTVSNKNKEQLDLNEANIKLNERINELQKQIDDINNIQKIINQNTLNIKELQNKISFLENNKEHINNEIIQLQEKKSEIDTSQLSNWEEELKETQEKLNLANENQKIMTTAATLLKDSGIKSRIIKTYVPIINQLIQKYLAILDFFVEFKLDEQFNETIHSRYRDKFSYESFSQGERMRIDLALMFTFRALAKLRGSVDINLIIFDEILDSAMDNDGIENLLKLIGGLTNNESIIIISHREGITEDKFNKVLKFQKIKNFSHLVE